MILIRVLVFALLIYYHVLGIGVVYFFSHVIQSTVWMTRRCHCDLLLQYHSRGRYYQQKPRNSGPARSCVLPTEQLHQ